MSIAFPPRRTVPLRRHLLLIAFLLTGVGVAAGFLLLHALSLDAARQRAEWLLRPQMAAAQARLDAVRAPVEAQLERLAHELKHAHETIPGQQLQELLIPQFSTYQAWEVLEVLHAGGAGWTLQRTTTGWITESIAADGFTSAQALSVEGLRVQDIAPGSVAQLGPPDPAEARAMVPGTTRWRVQPIGNAPVLFAIAETGLQSSSGFYTLRLALPAESFLAGLTAEHYAPQVNLYRPSGESLNSQATAKTGQDLPSSLLAWARNPQEVMSVVRVEGPAGPEWASVIRYLSGDSGPLMVLVGRVPEGQLLGFEQDLRGALLLLAAAVLFLALLAALWLNHTYTYPLRAFAERAVGLQRDVREHAYFPKTRIRELARLGEAIETLLVQAPAPRHEEPLTLSAPVEREEPPALLLLESAEVVQARELAIAEAEEERAALAAARTQLETERAALQSEVQQLESEKRALITRAAALQGTEQRLQALQQVMPQALKPTSEASEDLARARQALHAERQALAQEMTAFNAEKDDYARDRARLMAREDQLEAERAAIAEDWTKFQQEKVEMQRVQRGLQVERQRLAEEWQALQEQKAVVPPTHEDWTRLEAEREALHAQGQATEHTTEKLRAHELALEMDKARLAEERAALEAERQHWAVAEAALESERKRLATDREEMAAQVVEIMQLREEIRRAEETRAFEQSDLTEERKTLEALSSALQDAQEQLEQREASLHLREQEVTELATSLEARQSVLKDREQEQQRQAVSFEKRLENVLTRERTLDAGFSQLQERESVVVDLQLDVRQRETALAAAQAELEQKAQELNKVAASAHAQREDLERREAALGAREAALRDAQEALRSREAQAAGLEAELAESRATAEALLQTLREQQAALEEACAAQTRQATHLERMQQALEHQQQDLQSRQEALQRAQSEVEETQSTFAAQEAGVVERELVCAGKVAELEARTAEMRDQERNLQESLERLAEETARHTVAQEDLRERESALAQAQEALEEQQESLEFYREEFTRQQAALLEAERALSARESALRTREEEMRASQQQLEEQQAQFAVEQASLAALEAALRREKATLAEEQLRLEVESAQIREAEAAVHTAAQALEERTPPEAYRQAMESSRREIRQLKVELEEAYQEIGTGGKDRQIREARMQTHRQTLLEIQLLNEYQRRHAREALLAAAAMAGNTLGAGAHAVWIADERFSSLECQIASAGELVGARLSRDAAPMLFMALDHAPVLSVRDLNSDPRTRGVNLLPQPEGAALAVPVLADGRVRAVVVLGQASERIWEADEENFAQSLGLLLAPLLQMNATDAPALVPVPALTRETEQDDNLGESPQYRYMVESTGGIVWALNRDGKITFANPAAEEAYGCPVSEMLGKSITRFANGDGGKADLEAMKNVLDGLPSLTYRNTHLKSDGSPLRLAINMAALQDETGDVVGTVVVANASGSLDRLDPLVPKEDPGVVPALTEVIWMVDVSGRITYVNEAATHLYGYTVEELVGQSILMLSAQQHAGQDLARLNDALADRPCYGYLATHRRKDGGEIQVLILGEPHRTGSGEIAGVKGIAVDISRRKLKVKTRG